MRIARNPQALLVLTALGVLLHAPGTAGALEPEWTFSTGAPMLSSPKFADVDGDGTLEVILTTYGTGGAPYSSGWIHVLDASGDPLPGWPFYSSYACFSANACVGDVDGEAGVEVLVGDWSRLHLLSADGNEMPGWPRPIGINYAPTLADMDGDGDLEIIAGDGHVLYALHADGTLMPGWPVVAPDPIGPPAVGDLDGDGEAEVIAGTLQGPVGPEPFEVYVWELDGSVKPGFPKSTSGVCKGAPAVGDIDGDGVYEIVIPAYDESNNDYLYVWDAFGNPEPGWPQRAGRCRLSHPALADIDGDGQLEILIGGGRVSTPYRSMLFAFEPSGEAIAGFPIEIPHGSQINSGPIVGDLDGDPTLLEIVVKVSNHIYAYHSDGTLVAGFPYEQSDESHSGTHSPTPAMADVDEDGDLELVFCSCFDHVDFVDLDDPVDMSLAYWPSMKLDACNSSFTEAGSGTWVPPMFDEGSVTVLLQNIPNPLRSGSSTWIPFRLSRKLSCGARCGSSWIEILDPQGRCLQTIPIVDQQGGSSRVAWDGQDKFGVPVPSGVYLYRLAGAERSRARTMQVLR